MLIDVPESEVSLVCHTIAWARYWAHCKCEPESGWVCGFCKQRANSDFEAVIDRWAAILEASFRARNQGPPA